VKIKWNWFVEPPKRIFTNNKQQIEKDFLVYPTPPPAMTHIITPLLLFTTTILATTTTAVSPPATDVPWFREKYLKGIYNEYYIYTFSRWRLDDNHIDMCPELHKPAVYFAMTGRNLWNHTPLTHATYRQRQREDRRRQRRRQHNQGPGEYTAHYILWFEITVQDVVWFLIDFTLYCWELLILLLSVLMASLTTMILCMLVFGQY
jgi:hypothetical protein